MADILHETAENYFKYERLDEGKILLKKAVKILEYLQTTGKDYSMDRMLKIGNYNKTLNN
jgi:hypothetical protein